MSLADLGKNMAGSLLGMTEKAIIEFEDEEFGSKDVTITETKARSAGPSMGGVSASMSKMASQAVTSEIIDALGDVAGLSAILGKKKIRFKVKFNPSSISFRAVTGANVTKHDFTANEDTDSVEHITMKTRIQMNIQLVFDEYERTDAFMMEKFSDPMAMARTAATSVFGNPKSVRPQVEGFIGAMRSNVRKNVTFNWGDMCYKGILNQFSAEYTMFSMEGRPIRAVCDVGILCSDNMVKDGNKGQWDAAFKAAFETSLADKAAGAAGNLLNVKL